MIGLTCPKMKAYRRRYMTPEKLHIQTQLTNWLLRRTPTGGVRRVAPLAAAIASEIGNIRTDNQDRAVIVRGRDRHGRDYAIVAVADGIGGMRDGAACASLALGALVAALDQQAQHADIEGEQWIRNAAFAADEAVFAQSRGDGGSTLVALVIRPGFSVHWLSVGDSRVYSSNGKSLAQTSVDDTIAGQLGKNLEGASEQSKLLQFIGMGSELEPHIGEFGHGAVDAVLLTTDGVHYLSSASNWLGQIVNNAPDPGACVKRLVELAKWCGGPDNATIAMISLSTNWEPDDRPAYPCLEVWDAFGELQVIQGYPSASGESSYKRYDISALTLPQAGAIESQPESNEDSKFKGVGPGAQPSKAPRKSKTSSRKKNKTSLENHEEEAPQLSMKFPTKSV
jgi:serine/threonine protein phosphatase PrpC